MLDTKPELKQAILSNLGRGKENAVTGELLAQRLKEKSTRNIRQLMRELIAQGVCIIGSNSKPYGYFICDTQEEFDADQETEKNYIIELARSKRDKKRAWNLECERRRKIAENAQLPIHQISMKI